MIVEVLQPMRAIYLKMPVVAIFIIVMGVGYIVEGLRSALVLGAFILFIALSPCWYHAFITA